MIDIVVEKKNWRKSIEKIIEKVVEKGQPSQDEKNSPFLKSNFR